MKILITGGAGFIGKALRRYFEGLGHQVDWTSREHSESPVSGQIFLDLLKQQTIDSALKQVKPDVILHLAAQSSVKDSFEKWSETLDTNLHGSFVLFEKARNLCPGCQIISVGSSAEYGSLNKSHEFLSENLGVQPSSPYAYSKAAQAMMAEYFSRVFQMKIIHVRPFAVIGPEKRGDFVSDLLKQMVTIQKGQRSELKLGDVQRLRDFIDIEDFCGAIEVILENGRSGEVYNVANGESVSFSHLIELAADILKIKIKPPAVDPSKMRISDDYRLVANIEKLKQIGYQRKVSLSQSLQKIIEGIGNS